MVTVYTATNQGVVSLGTHMWPYSSEVKNHMTQGPVVRRHLPVAAITW